MAIQGDIARLGLEIRSDGVVVANRRLQDFIAQGKKAQTTGDRMEASWNRVNKALGAVGITVGAAATVTALTAAVDKAVRTFAEYEKQLASVSTMLNKVEMGNKAYSRTLNEFDRGLRELSVSMGESTRTLSKGLYDILSASVAPSKAMDVLAISAKAAKAGMTDTATSVDFITSSLNAYGMRADQAGRVSDIAFATVARGKTTFQELAASIGQVAPGASQAGVGLEQLGAMMATVTRQGIRTAEAAQGLNQLFITFARQAPQAVKAWEEVRKGTALARAEFNTQLIQGENLLKFIEVMRSATDKQRVSILAEANALKVFNAITQDAVGYQKDLHETMNAAGKTQDAYAKMTGTLADKMDKAATSADELWRTLGQSLEPASKTALDAAIGILNSLTKSLKEAMDQAERAKAWDKLPWEEQKKQYFKSMEASKNGPGTLGNWAQQEEQRRLRELGLEGPEAYQPSKAQMEYLDQKAYERLIKLKLEQAAGLETLGVGLAGFSGAKSSPTSTKPKIDKSAVAKAQRLYDSFVASGDEAGLAPMDRDLARLMQSYEEAQKANANSKQRMAQIDKAYEKQALAIMDKYRQKKQIELDRDQTKQQTARNRALENRVRAEEQISDRVAKLTLSETEYKNYQLQKQLDAYQKAGASQEQIERLKQAELAEINKSGFQRILESYQDTSKVMETLTDASLRGMHKGFADTLGELIPDEIRKMGGVWGSTLNAMLDAFIQILAQMATAWFASGIAKLFGGGNNSQGLNIFGSQGSTGSNAAGMLANTALGKAMGKGWDYVAGLFSSESSASGMSLGGAGGMGTGSSMMTGFGSAGGTSYAGGMSLAGGSSYLMGSGATTGAFSLGGAGGMGTGSSMMTGFGSAGGTSAFAGSGATATGASGAVGAGLAAGAGIAGIAAIAVMMASAMADEAAQRSDPAWNKLQLALTASRETKRGSLYGRDYDISGSNNESGQYLGIGAATGQLPTMQLLDGYMSAAKLSEADMQAYVDGLANVDAAWLAQNDRIKKVDKDIKQLADTLADEHMYTPIETTTAAVTEMAARFGLAGEQVAAWSQGIRDGSLTLEDLQAKISAASSDVVMGLGDMNQATLDIANSMGLLGDAAAAYSDQSGPMIESFLRGAATAEEFRASLASMGQGLGLSKNSASALADRVYYMSEAIRNAGINAGGLDQMLASLGLSASDVGDKLYGKLAAALMDTAGSAWYLTREAAETAHALDTDLAKSLAAVGQQAEYAAQPVENFRRALASLPSEVSTTITTNRVTNEVVNTYNRAMGYADSGSPTYHSGGIVAAALANKMITDTGGSVRRYHSGGEVLGVLQPKEIVWSHQNISDWGGIDNVERMRTQGPKALAPRTTQFNINAPLVNVEGENVDEYQLAELVVAKLKELKSSGENIGVESGGQVLV